MPTEYRSGNERLGGCPARRSSTPRITRKQEGRILEYFQVDVFTSTPLAGNGLAVVFAQEGLSGQTLQAMAGEFNQFETIFVYPQQETGVPVRIFTVDEELEFAGHPVLGAGAVIHRRFFAEDPGAEIGLVCAGRKISVRSRRESFGYTVEMNQGPPRFVGDLPRAEYSDVAAALNLRSEDLDERFPLEVVSTGLPYLLVPVGDCLDRARIVRPGFDDYLARFGAKFAYLFNAETLECRTWDNAGLVEDVATGSAAGPLCAYLVKHGLRKAREEVRIYQGRHAGRPGEIYARLSKDLPEGEVFVSGGVAFFARGEVLF